MSIKPRKIVLSSGVRTPIGHIARSLSECTPESLLKFTGEDWGEHPSQPIFPRGREQKS